MMNSCMYNVRMFLARAVASTEVEGPYRPRDKHAMLIFVRQTVESEHDWALAEAGATGAGWTGVLIEKAGTIGAENLNGKDQEFRDAFESATQGSCGIVVYREPIPAGDA